MDFTSLFHSQQVICLIFLSITIYLFTPIKLSEDLPRQDLIIGILSKRTNFKYRNAIRETWGKDIKNHSGIKLLFVLGNKNCQIEEPQRLSPYSCSDYHIDYAALSNRQPWDTESLSSSKKDHLLLNDYYFAFGFRILHPVLLTHLGVNRQLLDKVYNVTLIFKDPEEVFEEVSLSLLNCDNKEYFCKQKLNSSLLLPQGFEGEIMISKLSFRENGYYTSLWLDNKVDCKWMNGSSIGYLFIRSYEGVIYPWRDNGCSHVMATFINQFDDNAKIESKINENNETNIAQRIEVENSEHQDLLLLPLIDVYSNIPLKLLLFLQWISRHYRTDYLLKTDDDTYVNTTLLLNLLKGTHLQGSSCYSHFHHNRMVPIWGKWADYQYPGISYPSFPSGSGYVLTGDIVETIGANAQVLKIHNGEDVSMGIWMNSLNFIYSEPFLSFQVCTQFPSLVNFGLCDLNATEKMLSQSVNYIEVPCWLNSEHCSNSYFVSDVSVRMMKQLYNNNISK